MKKLLALLLSCALLLSLLPAVYAEEATGEPVLVWDMENVPENLYTDAYAMDVHNHGGYYNEMLTVNRAEGKGHDGGTAIAITMLEKAKDNLGSNAVYLRLNKDDTAKTDWLGLEQFWFWVDVSAFNSKIDLELMIDGVHPKDGRTCYTYDGNEKKSYLTTSDGKLPLPQGYKGWVGIDAASFDSTFGVVQNVAIGISPSSDTKRFPLTMYVDDFYVICRDESANSIYASGDLFNKDISVSDNKLYINLTDVHQQVAGFGASGAWWTTAAGTGPFIDHALELLYTDKGIALNTYRHNIGGSVKEDLSDGGGGGNSGGRWVPSPLTEDGKYVEDRDIGAYTVLMKLKELGTVEDFTLFINSPPSTMTNSGKTFADPWADSYSNLREDCYDEFAEYVVDMVQLYNWCGIPVKYVSPINEPQWDWKGGQEGCHYTALEAIEVLSLVAQELKDRIAEDPTLADVRLSITECANWTEKDYLTFVALKMMGDDVLNEMTGNLCAHSYYGTASHKDRLIKDLWAIKFEKPLHQSEYGPSFTEAELTMNGAMDVARIMYEDLSILDVLNWSFWLAVSNGSYSDGLLYCNTESTDVIDSKRFYVMGNYSKFVTGAYRVTVDEYGMPNHVLSTAYVNPEDGSLVYVVVNDSNTDHTFSFAGLPAGSVAEVYETSRIRNLELRGTMTADAGYILPAESVTTFVFNGVELTEVVNGGHPDNLSGGYVDPEFDFSIFEAKQEEPEAPSTPAPTTPVEQKPDNTGWIIGGVVAVLAVAAVIVVILGKKKKK